MVEEKRMAVVVGRGEEDGCGCMVEEKRMVVVVW
jgi:hypothetical protein